MAKLYFYYSAMNAGKSTTLLQSAYNYKERGMSTLLFTPAFDFRAGAQIIASRIGLSAPAVPFEETTDLYTETKLKQQKDPSLKCVLIDEAQFLSKDQVIQSCEIADKLNIPVLTYGLRSDFRGEPFPGSLYLLAWAEELIEIKTICHCGRKATMNLRLDEKGNAIRDGEQVLIGGNESYLSVCRIHYKSALGE